MNVRSILPVLILWSLKLYNLIGTCLVYYNNNRLFNQWILLWENPQLYKPVSKRLQRNRKLAFGGIGRFGWNCFGQHRANAVFSVSVECCSGKLQRHINMAQTLHTSGIHYASTKLLNINFKSLNIALLRNVKNLIYSTVKYVCLHLDK